MNTLPRDLTEEIALKLSPADLVNLCSTNTTYNKLLCNSNTFWIKKLYHDYPDETKEIGNIPIPNAKNIYMKRFLYVTEKIEKFMEKFIEIIWEPYNFAKYLNDKYKKDLYDALYNIYKVVIQDYKEDDEIEIDDMDDIFYDFILSLLRDVDDADSLEKLQKYKVALFEDFQRTPRVYEFI